MSGLYNMVVGYDPAAGAVIHALGVTKDEIKTGIIPRFRDAYIDLDGDEPRLVLFTRTGGGNRAEYEEENEALRQRPGFIDDFDDSFDATFAHWRYSMPAERKDALMGLIAEGKAVGYDFPKPMDRFQQAVGQLNREVKAI